MRAAPGFPEWLTSSEAPARGQQDFKVRPLVLSPAFPSVYARAG